MNIYLAGRPVDHGQINSYAEQLEGFDIHVVSTWHRSDALWELGKQQLQHEHALQLRTANSLLKGLDESLSIDTNADQSEASVRAPSFSQWESAADRFRHEIESADCMIADAEISGLDAGYAIAKGKKLCLIGSSQSPLSRFFADKIEFFSPTWPHAILLIKARRDRAIIAGAYSGKSPFSES